MSQKKKEEKRVSEPFLVLPALDLMEQNGGHITTRQLHKPLRKMFSPRDKDLAQLKSRNDDSFSQKVRNLKSHDKLEKLGFAKYDAAQKCFEITAKGRQYLAENRDAMEYLQGFDVQTMIDGLNEITSSRQKVLVFNENDGNEPIREGGKEAASTSSYARSRKLREYAVKYFSQGGLRCACCGFDFGLVYGELGEGLIEMHHIKPVFQYERDDMEKSMAEAVKNLAPVCSNCHRVIHRNRMKPVGIDELISTLKHNEF